MAADDDAPAGARPVLDTAIIMTARLSELAGFYRDGLGLGEPGIDEERHVGWNLGDVYFGLDRVDDWTGTPPAAVTLWFAVDDLEATYRRLLDLGAQSRMEPTTKPWGARLASVLDPDGHVVGLSQQ